MRYGKCISDTLALMVLSLGIAMSTSAQRVSYSPYKDPATNTIYNLLFCDDLALYKKTFSGPVEGPWQTLFADLKDARALQQLATDQSAESRMRILAFNALGKNHPAAQKKELLGIVLEVGREDGLRTFAVYQDHRVRYINESGKILSWETVDARVDAKIVNLLSQGEKVVARLGRWDKSRLPPPRQGAMRVTFLVSDGLYWGHGQSNMMTRDPIGGAVVQAADELLFELTSRATK